MLLAYIAHGDVSYGNLVALQEAGCLLYVDATILKISVIHVSMVVENYVYICMAGFL